MEGKKPLQAFYMELDLRNFKFNFNNLVAIFGRTGSGFDNGRKIHFFAHPDLVKSDSTKGALQKAYER